MGLKHITAVVRSTATASVRAQCRAEKNRPKTDIDRQDRQTPQPFQLKFFERVGSVSLDRLSRKEGVPEEPPSGYQMNAPISVPVEPGMKSVNQRNDTCSTVCAGEPVEPSIGQLGLEYQQNLQLDQI